MMSKHSAIRLANKHTQTQFVLVNSVIKHDQTLDTKLNHVQEVVMNMNFNKYFVILQICGVN